MQPISTSDVNGLTVYIKKTCIKMSANIMQYVNSSRQAYINQTYFQISQIHLDINANSSVLPPIISELRKKLSNTLVTIDNLYDSRY